MAIAVVAHDAGGAEVISSYVRRNPDEYVFSISGPATSVFEKKLGIFHSKELRDTIEVCDSILCGTGWQSIFEWQAIKLARKFGKYSIAFLDHWVNYRERFIREGELCVPDEIWVGDTYAREKALVIFPGMPLKLVPNPYFQDIKDRITQLANQSTEDHAEQKILYVCEPIGEHALSRHGDEGYWGYSEHDALNYFLSNLRNIGIEGGRIMIRPHPSESAGKYDWVRRNYDRRIGISRGRDLVEEVVDADIIVGCSSTAMVVGLLASKRVICSIPLRTRDCSLPFPQIEYLRDLLSTGSN